MNRRVLVLGAGRSATALISFLLERAAKLQYHIIVADQSLDLAKSKIAGYPPSLAVATALEATRQEELVKLVANADVAVSLLPPPFHPSVAAACLMQNTHLVTASYWTEDMMAKNQEVADKGLLFMGELGLDPGIDHMSAMALIDQIKNEGGFIRRFSSYTGGLVAPESDDNPWHYKITWNPDNVVGAGMGGAVFLEDRRIKYLPYHRLFRSYRQVNIQDWGMYEVYPNRDSTKYLKLYGLEGVDTLYRGTIRHLGFCDAWDVLVQLGIPDRTPLFSPKPTTNLGWLSSFLSKREIEALPGSLLKMMANPRASVIEQLKWLGIFDDSLLLQFEGLSSGFEWLKQLLLQKWAMAPADKDLVLMQHDITYELNRMTYELSSTMAYTGENAAETAMTKLVGLPLGVYVELLLDKKIQLKGVQIPTHPKVYQPVLEGLRPYHVVFKDNVKRATRVVPYKFNPFFMKLKALLNLQRYFTKIGALQLFQVMRQGSTVVIAILLAKSTLGLGGIGTYEKLGYIGYTISYFWIVGLVQSLLTLYPKQSLDQQKAFFSTAYFIFVSISLLLFGVLYFFSDWVVWVFTTKSALDFFLLYSVFLLFNLPTFLLENFFLVKDQPLNIIKFGILTFGGQLLAVVLPPLFQYPFVYSFYSLIIVGLIKHIWLVWFLSRQGIWKIDWYLAKQWTWVALPLMFYAFVNGVNLAYDNWLVNYVFKGDNRMFAIFRYGSKELPIVIAMANAFSMAMLGDIAKDIHQGVKAIREKSVRLLLQIFPLSIFFMLSSTFIYRIVFDDTFTASAPIFNVYLFTMISRLTFPHTIIISQQDNHVMAIVSIIELLINMVASYILVQYMGLVGIAWGTVISDAVEKLIYAAFVWYKYKIPFYHYTPVEWFVPLAAVLIGCYGLSV